MLKELEIEVTDEDIKKGEQFSCIYCPVARAMSRALGFTIEVYGAAWLPHRRDRPLKMWEQVKLTSDKQFLLPYKVVRFIEKFDKGNFYTGVPEVLPFKFRLKVDENLLKASPQQ